MTPLLLLLLASLVSCFSGILPLYVQKLSGTPIRIGELSFEGPSLAHFAANDNILAYQNKTFQIKGIDHNDEACFGYYEDDRFICFAYQKVKYPFLASLEVLPGHINLVSRPKSKTELVPVHVSKHAVGPKPSLKEVEVKQKLSKEELEKQKLENQSFLQKYWMYIIPVAIMLLMGGGGQQ